MFNFKDIIKKLAMSRDPKELKQLWSASQDIFSIYRKQFPNILKLTEKAAKANGIVKTPLPPKNTKN